MSFPIHTKQNTEMNYEPYKTDDHAGKHAMPENRKKPVPPVKREYGYRETLECDDDASRKFIRQHPMIRHTALIRSEEIFPLRGRVV